MKLQQMSRRPYKNIDGVETEIEVRDDLLFMHMTVTKWNQTVLRNIREELEKALLEFEDWGYDVLFVTSESEKSAKMWNMIKPCFSVQKLEKYGAQCWLGSWITGEGEWEPLN